MQIVGPLPVSPVGRNLPTLDIKSFQRVNAQILQVSGTRVILSIDGVPIVAEVLSSELAADLKERASAQFTVSQMEDGKTVLRLINPGQSPSLVAGQPAGSLQNLSLHLLNELGFPVNSENQIAAQAAINQRMTLQPGQLDLLLQTLAGLPGWGAEEANLAAAILVSGLPLTPQSLELAAHPGSMSAETLTNLLGQLKAALQDPEVPQELINRVYQILQESVVDAGLPADLPEKLAQAIQILGRPLENLVLEEMHSFEIAPGSGPHGLALLTHLQQEAARGGKIELAQVLNDFLQSLVRVQWQNIPSTAQNQHQDWIEAALWMRMPVMDSEMENASIRLRIDRSPKHRPPKIGASHAHMIVQVELPGQQLFQVEIELSQHQVKADVTIPDDSLYEAAREELSGLACSLQDQGYSLGDARVEVGVPERFDKITILPLWGNDLSGVDLEV